MENPTLASLSDRLFGQILDSLVAVVGFFIAGILVAISPTIGGIVLLIAVVFAIFYILFADGFVGGQSWFQRSQFEPAQRDGRPVPGTFETRFRTTVRRTS